jgi:hypothetical protein
MGVLNDLIDDIVNLNPPGTAEIRDAAARERQLKDWQIARQALYEAQSAVKDGAIYHAMAHALVGILALQMSES